MSQSRRHNTKRVPKATPSLPVVHPHSAGIDVGSDAMWVSVPTDSSPTPIARFAVFTEDLLALAAWLKECHVRSVAMESTGVYWIPLYELLEEQGFDVTLVSPNYPKKPDKTDVEDCQWLQYLHSVGLLRGSFRPPEAVCAIRAILRHRATLISQASAEILRMQKSLTQMNALLHNVVSDITGVTGLAIIDAIINGERNPQTLAKFRDHRIKATLEEIEKSLVGNYRAEHVFTLKQSRRAYDFHQEQIAECDAQIEQMLAKIDADPPEAPPSDTPQRRRTGRNDIRLPHGDLRSEMTRILSVDLAHVPGIGPNTVCALFTELGANLSQFPSAAHFASWLRLCPRPKISGGKVLGRAGRPAGCRLAVLLRQVAQSLDRTDSYLGHFYRRMKAKFGPSAANKATAHKLARIIYAIMTTKAPYDPDRFNEAQQQLTHRRIHKLQKEAKALGFKIATA